MRTQLQVEPPCAPMASDFVPFWLRAGITTLVEMPSAAKAPPSLLPGYQHAACTRH